MIADYEKFRLPDENHENDIIIEVNWKPDDPKSNGCQLLRMIGPGGEVSVIRREHLNHVLFAIGDPADQRKLLPMKVENVHHQLVNLEVVAKKDIRKGDKISLKEVPLSIPCTIARSIIGGENFSKAMPGEREKSGIWLGK